MLLYIIFFKNLIHNFSTLSNQKFLLNIVVEYSIFQKFILQLMFLLNIVVEYSLFDNLDEI